MNTLYPYQQDPRPSRPTDLTDFLAQLNESAELEVQARGFSLTLGNGSRWWIGSSPGASCPAETLATLMQLREGDPGYGRVVFFYEKNADHPHLEHPLLKAQNWIKLYPFHFQIWLHPRWHHVLCEYDSSDRQRSVFPLLSAAVHAMHWDSIGRGGLPLHATLLEHQGQGFLLAGPGGTGKSTCGRRVVVPWRALCDDEVLVVPAPAGGYLVHPIPTWSDYFSEQGEKTWNVAEALPLAGLFFLEQAPEDEVIPLGNPQAAVATSYSAEQIMFFQFLFGANSREVRGLRLNMFDNACALVKQVPAFRLRVSLTGKFWEKIEAAMG